MELHDIAKRYAAQPQTAALRHLLEDASAGDVFLQGLAGSAAPTLFAALSERMAGKKSTTFLLILNDGDEAGYFFHDLTQLLQTGNLLFFPSSYRRSAKYGQRDAANEILRTEVLVKIEERGARNEERTPSPTNHQPSTINHQPSTIIVTYPEALSEPVMARELVDERVVRLKTGGTADIVELEQQLRDLGFQEVDYVYEPGQFAVRGGILDVFSYSCELPFRIDFFGDEIDSIRTFEVQDQLSKEQRDVAEIVPELATVQNEKMVSFLDYLPADTLLAAKDFDFLNDIEGLSSFRKISFGATAKKAASNSVINFNTSPQPLFHKNIDLLKQSVGDYWQNGYKLYVLADSRKQHQRLQEILRVEEHDFTAVNKTLHEGFIDHDLQACFFTDHQIFDRFHKFTLKSERARQGKMALTMKELQEMEIGD
ncbi:MAG: transcription-repair coupling factor, partial [Prevotella sp.]|nr:transcription-repair coupling factor [Prevotella sp.]